MRQYATTHKVLFTKGTEFGWGICEVKSESNHNVTYRVDMTHGRCSCPAWIHQSGGERKICKHLRKLGFKQLIEASDGLDFKEPVKISTTPEKVKVLK